MINEFDKIKLKSGEIGYIADKLDDTHFYADISKQTGEIETVLVSLRDIQSKFVEYEEPVLIT